MKMVITTYPQISCAEKVAKILVKKKFAACVQILPKMNSIYNWKGEIKNDNEFLTIIKTNEIYLSEVIKIIFETHPYNTPEIIEVEGNILNSDYKKWFKESLWTE